MTTTETEEKAILEMADAWLAHHQAREQPRPAPPDPTGFVKDLLDAMCDAEERRAPTQLSPPSEAITSPDGG